MDRVLLSLIIYIANTSVIIYLAWGERLVEDLSPDRDLPCCQTLPDGVDVDLKQRREEANAAVARGDRGCIISRVWKKINRSGCSSLISILKNKIFNNWRELNQSLPPCQVTMQVMSVFEQHWANIFVRGRPQNICSGFHQKHFFRFKLLITEVSLTYSHWAHAFWCVSTKNTHFVLVAKMYAMLQGCTFRLFVNQNAWICTVSLIHLIHTKLDTISVKWTYRRWKQHRRGVKWRRTARERWWRRRWWSRRPWRRREWGRTAASRRRPPPRSCCPGGGTRTGTRRNLNSWILRRSTAQLLF